MDKTKLGVSVNLLSAVIFFLAISFSLTDIGLGSILLPVIAGYVLLKEKNPLLKHNTIRAFLLTILVSVAVVLVNLVPDVFNILAGLIPDRALRFSLAYASFVDVVDTGAGIIVSLIMKLRIVLLVILGIMALSGKTIRIPVVDKMIARQFTVREAGPVTINKPDGEEDTEDA